MHKRTKRPVTNDVNQKATNNVGSLITSEVDTGEYFVGRT